MIHFCHLTHTFDEIDEINHLIELPNHFNGF